jgi:hypothetical protein
LGEWQDNSSPNEGEECCIEYFWGACIDWGWIDCNNQCCDNSSDDPCAVSGEGNSCGEYSEIELLIDCNDECGGNATLDNCGTCDTFPTNDCVQDCASIWGGNAELDSCGTCDTDSSNDCDYDCFGTFEGDAELDECDVCDNDPSNDCVEDCLGVWGGNLVDDQCGVCGGDNSSCACVDCSWVSTAVEDYGHECCITEGLLGECYDYGIIDCDGQCCDASPSDPCANANGSSCGASQHWPSQSIIP